jgi:hypothetical protein
MTGKKTLKERETELDELVRKNGEWGWYDEQRSDK